MKGRGSGIGMDLEGGTRAFSGRVGGAVGHWSMGTSSPAPGWDQRRWSPGEQRVVMDLEARIKLAIQRNSSRVSGSAAERLAALEEKAGAMPAFIRDLFVD